PGSRAGCAKRGAGGCAGDGEVAPRAWGPGLRGWGGADRGQAGPGGGGGDREEEAGVASLRSEGAGGHRGVQVAAGNTRGTGGCARRAVAGGSAHFAGGEAARPAATDLAVVWGRWIAARGGDV